MKRIKEVIREGVWETNSSSTHSMVIYNTDLVRREDEDCTLKIEDNKLYVESCSGFGWEFFKTNDCTIKLQYVCGLMCKNYLSVKGQKSIKKLKNLLKGYLNVDDVIFEWDEVVKKENESQKEETEDDVMVGGVDPGDWRNVPDIDHQSVSESFDVICEDRKSIINFIFSRKSWLFGGNDNSEYENDFFKEVSLPCDPILTGSVDFRGKIGRIDFEFFSYSYQVVSEEIRKDPRVDYSFYNMETGEVEICTGFDEPKFSGNKKYIPFSRVENVGTSLFIVYDNGRKLWDKALEEGDESFSVKLPVELNSNEFGKLC